MGEELFLKVFGDPSLDDDVVAVALVEGSRVSTGGSRQGTAVQDRLTSSQSQGRSKANKVSGSRCLRWTWGLC